MFKIAIDGPAGAGKSTIAKIVANKLGIEYIDTGAMYRAITLKALRLGINMENEEEYDFLDDTVLDIENGRFLMDNEDVSEAIRTVEVTENVSTPSKIGRVRTYLVAYQQKISNSKSVIMDGRDIGTVVLVDAQLKIYLIASVECRARRRMLEREASGVFKSLEETMQEIETRDLKDSTRKISPLKCAEDAIVIDSSNLSIDEVVNEIIFYVNERGLLKMSENEKYFEGQTVKGIVTGVNSGAIYLEIEEGVKAVIYAKDILEMPKSGALYDEYSEGSEFKAQIKSIGKDKKNPNCILLTLSTKLQKEAEDAAAREEAIDKKYEDLVAVREADEIIEAKVVRANAKGTELSYKGAKLFCPAAQCSVSPEAMEKMKGQTLSVIILKVDVEHRFVLVSQIAAEKKTRRLAKEAALAAIEVGQVVEGEVQIVLEYGAIVKLGLVSGLLHVTELDHFKVADVKKVLTVGQKITVKVIKIEGDKISLSVKALSQHPWDILKEQYHEGDVFDGTVEKIIPAGLIIKLTDNYSGLMPNAEYSWRTNEKVEGNVAEGDTIQVKVMSIDDKKHRVSLSHKATVENAWADIKLRRGDIIEVTVASVNEKGAQVNYKNVSGFLPVSEVSNTKRVNSVTDLYPVDTVVSAMVQDFDAGRAKLVVSVKAIEAKKERDTFDSYMKEQEKENTGSTLEDIFKKYQEEE